MVGTTNSNNFQKQCEFGSQGENEVKEFLLNHPSTVTVVDVANDKWFQQFDIDLLQTTKDGINKIEVKTDSMAHKTGNIAYEVISNKYSGSIGCFEKTQADYLFYYIKETHYLLIFNMGDLRKYVEEHKGAMSLKEMGDYALGYLIKIKDLNEICTKINLKGC